MAIVIIGAGSAVFTRTLVSDLLQAAATRDVELRLVDTDPVRLALATALCRRLVAESGDAGARVTAFPDRRQALPGARYVISTILVGGRPGIEADLLIPARYGVNQTVGDTLGIGGISRGLRTIPEIVRIARDVEELAPDALVLNYTNPMSMVVMALAAATGVRHFGLCHSISNTASELADYLDVPFAELVWDAAGVNHMAWFTRLERQGQDLYPRLFALPASDPDLVAGDGVRFELMRRFGYFCSESSKHAAEYFSFFLPHDGEIPRLRIPVGRQRLDALDQLQADHDALAGRLGGARPLLTEPSNEYAPALIAALESGRSFTFYPNVANRIAGGVLIGNLPAEAAVEVVGTVRNGAVSVSPVPDLPPGPAALNRQAITVQQLTVQAVLDHDLDLVYQAALLDPQVSAILKPDRAVALVDDLLDAHGPALPELRSRRLVALAPAAQSVVAFRIDDLDVEVHPGNQALGAAAADAAAEIINAAVERSGTAGLVLATGNSQVTFLAALRRQNIAWPAVTVFHMDEYLNLPAGHPAAFATFLRRHLLDEVRVRAFYPVPGHPADLTSACRGYEALLRAHPVDLCVLGIGENGHLAFNDPPANFGETDWVKVVDLDERSRRQQVGEGHFDRLDEVPTRAISLTVTGLRSAARMLCLAPERRKAEAVRRALTGPVDGSCPASVLRQTPHARLLLDRDSASLLELSSSGGGG